MTSNVHALVECMDDTDRVRAAADGQIVWHTTAPMVAEVMQARGEKIVWADDALPVGWSSAIGLACRDAAFDLEPRFAAIAAELGSPGLRPLLCRSVASLLSLLTFKQAVIEAFARADGRKIVVGVPQLTPAGAGIEVATFDTLFRVLADGLDVETVDAPDRDTSALERDFDRGLLSDRLLSLLDLSPGQRLWRRMRLHPHTVLGPKRSSGRVYVARNNEAIREMLPHLIEADCSIALLPTPKLGAPGEPEPAAPNALDLQQALEAALAERGVAVQTKRLAQIAAERLRSVSRRWRSTMRLAADAAERLAGNGPTVIVTNTVSGLPLTMLTDQAAARGVPTVVVEHGVSAGLSRFHEVLRRWAEPAHGSVYLACAPRAVSFFREEPALDPVRFEVIGLPAQTRHVPLRRLQRIVARRRLGAWPGQRVVVYLGRSVQNNTRKIAHSPEDAHLHRIQRTIADEVLPRVHGVPVMKLYSTRRYIDGDPLLEGFAPPQPVRTLKAGDFRFLRAAADVILLETPLSTLGWALGAGVPVFFLADPMTPLRPGAREALSRALFFFDLTQPDWADAVVAALNQDLAEIGRQWAAKAAARETLLRDWVFGPGDAGRLGSVAVRSLLDPPAPTQIACAAE